ncbi:two-component system sensor histidine kinase NtrB [Sphingopyxis sp. MSC1_008]|jgi:two-component system sensor kinase FixL|uniref:two-component system sensor histidine kinase NtrB n=1 Tax=Sphingopyxis sp. MSC1_008 TaxID=2909265 RepID=UPI0020C07F98|nr:PAS domain-containing sensor histidine kinase [Sphingopyxis sp. MSC1_008]
MQDIGDSRLRASLDDGTAGVARLKRLIVLDGSPHGALIVDRVKGAILWANEAAKKAHGGHGDELLSLLAGELLVGLGDRLPVDEVKGIGRPGVIVQFRMSNGSMLPVEVFEQELSFSDQREVSLLHLRDASGQFGAVKLEERLRRLLADSFSATTIIAADGTIRYVAPSIQHILGYSETDFLGMNIRRLHHPDERKQVSALVRKIPSDGTPLRMETRIRHADGSYRHIESTVRNFTNHPDVGGILASFRDITERVEAERDARKRAEEVHILARYWTMAELGSAIAHELNQPVAAIRNYADGCLRSLPASRDLEQTRWALEQIAAEAERATRIMRSVHDFTMHKRIERRLWPIRDILDDIAAFLQLKVQEGNASLIVEVKASRKAWCDKTLIGQVILNLALNGIEAMSEKGGRGTLRISADDLDDDFVQITVSDCGEGMRSEQLEALFQTRMTTKAHGFGLGLVLSRSIVSNHGGKLWADSTLGEGTSFYLTLPRRSQKNQVFTFSR